MIKSDMFKGIKENFLMLGEYILFLVKSKKFWLIPLIIFIVIFALLVVAANISPFLPFVYTLF
jgi:hypothetical protein